MKKFLLSKYLSFYLSGFILLCLVLCYFLIPSFQEFLDQTINVILEEDKERTREYFKQFGIWGPLAIIVFIILQMFLIIFPSLIPIIVSVMAYGFWLGLLISLTGFVIASTLGYYIGKQLKNAFLIRIIGEDKMKKMNFWISNYSFGTVVLFRISPFLSTDAISFIAGMMEMSYKKFIYATLTGMIPLSIGVGYFSEDISKLEDGLYWLGVVGLVSYGIYVYIDHKKRLN